MLGINDLGSLGTEFDDSALAETADDDFHIRIGKRLRRAAALFRNPLSIPRLAVSTLILLPLQYVMGFLFQQSKSSGTDVLEYSMRVNTTITKLVNLRGADVEGEEWRLP